VGSTFKTAPKVILFLFRSTLKYNSITKNKSNPYLYSAFLVVLLLIQLFDVLANSILLWPAVARERKKHGADLLVDMIQGVLLRGKILGVGGASNK
jgi:hypothetical protein